MPRLLRRYWIWLPFAILYAAPILCLFFAAWLMRPYLSSPLPLPKPSRDPEPDWPTAVLQWHGLPPASDFAERSRIGARHTDAINEEVMLKPILTRPDVSELGIVLRQPKPMVWLKNNLHVSVFESVIDNFGPAKDFPATVTTAVGIFAPQAQGSLLAAGFMANWRVALEPNGALTLCLSLAGRKGVDQHDLIQNPAEQVIILNAIAEAYLERVRDKAHLAEAKASRVSLRKADVNHPYPLR